MSLPTLRPAPPLTDPHRPIRSDLIQSCCPAGCLAAESPGTVRDKRDHTSTVVEWVIPRVLNTTTYFGLRYSFPLRPSEQPSVPAPPPRASRLAWQRQRGHWAEGARGSRVPCVILRSGPRISRTESCSVQRGELNAFTLKPYVFVWPAYYQELVTPIQQQQHSNNNIETKKWTGRESNPR